MFTGYNIAEEGGAAMLIGVAQAVASPHVVAHMPSYGP